MHKKGVSHPPRLCVLVVLAFALAAQASRTDPWDDVDHRRIPKPGPVNYLPGLRGRCDPRCACRAVAVKGVRHACVLATSDHTVWAARPQDAV